MIRELASERIDTAEDICHPDVINSAGGGSNFTQECVVPLGELEFQVRHADLDPTTENPFFFADPLIQLKLKTIESLLIDGKLPCKSSRRGFDGPKFHGLEHAVRTNHFERNAFGFERVVLFVLELCPHIDRVAEHVGVPFDEQHATVGTPEESPLAHMANHFGVEGFKVSFVDRSQSPHFATAEIQHPA